MLKRKVTRLNKASFRKAITSNLLSYHGVDPKQASVKQWYLALGRALADHTTLSIINTEQTKAFTHQKSVNYISLEFLIGRLTGNNIINMGLFDEVSAIMAEFGQELSAILEQEDDPALGNGGLGRLAACFLDSCATLQKPTIGYGLFYDYGLFKQSFEQGYQVEQADDWKPNSGYPWAVKRENLVQSVGFYGKVEVYQQDGTEKRRWQPALTINAIPFDLPIVGFANNRVHPLRLWQGESIQPFDFSAFNEGQFTDAQQSSLNAQNLTKVLYPNDNHPQGQCLRLMQQYFMSAASLADILQRHLKAGHPIESLPKFETIQLNDTHPAISIPELMRQLLDEHHLTWEHAWDITCSTFAYTNHTLLPEALESWPEALIAELLPRHLELIHEINHRFLIQVADKWPNDVEKLQKLSIIQEGAQRTVRMANLSVIGSYAVNGVAALHSELVKKDLFPEFDQFYPGKIKNITNGVTPRRWIHQANPLLSKLITSKIGDEWITDLTQLDKLSPLAKNPVFQREFMAIKTTNKQRLAKWVKDNLDIDICTDAMFDVQIKRLHEYKRQHLNLLHVISLYLRLLSGELTDTAPRVVIFAAKAAPGYQVAKDIISAINAIADVINHDSRTNDRLKMIFIPDYNVSKAELIIPASDLSEQISTAGKEASGTGNMKLALNGALTIGTLDGANVEIAQEVGEENIFIFGLTTEEVASLWHRGYQPQQYIDASPLLQRCLASLLDGTFVPRESNRLRPLYDTLVHHGDNYLALADFDSYVDAQARASELFMRPNLWAQKAILNCVKNGKFSSDRSISDYASKIWNI